MNWRSKSGLQSPLERQTITVVTQMYDLKTFLKLFVIEQKFMDVAVPAEMGNNELL